VSRLFCYSLVLYLHLRNRTPAETGRGRRARRVSIGKDASTGARSDHDVANASAAAASVAKVNVLVDTSKPRNIVGYRAFGIHTSVYDSNLISPQVVTLLKAAAINTLRYPGGGYADNYHWSNYKPTKWQAEEPPNMATTRPTTTSATSPCCSIMCRTGLRHNCELRQQSGRTGAGEPAEAAAWVAYCNGDPSDEKVIGKDSTGYDWKTVGYWATMRASLSFEKMTVSTCSASATQATQH